MAAEDTTELPDETTAQRELEELERAVMDGEIIPPARLVEAREKVSLAALFRKGREARAEKQKLADAAAAREAAKVEVREMFEQDDPAGTLEKARDAISEAVNAYAAAIDAHNATLREGKLIYERVRLPQPNMNQLDILDVDGLDRNYYARVGHGDELTMLVVDGTRYAPMQRDGALVKALSTAAARPVRFEW